MVVRVAVNNSLSIPLNGFLDPKVSSEVHVELALLSIPLNGF